MIPSVHARLQQQIHKYQSLFQQHTRNKMMKGPQSLSGFILKSLQGFARLVYSSLLSVCPQHLSPWNLASDNSSCCSSTTWASVTAYSSGKCPPRRWMRVLLSWKLKVESIIVEDVEGQTAVLALLWCWRVPASPAPHLCSLYPQTRFLRMLRQWSVYQQLRNTKNCRKMLQWAKVAPLMTVL